MEIKRKTISITEELKEELNRYRLGGESWNVFLEALLPEIKKLRE